MSLTHTFNIAIANTYDVNTAVFLNNVAHWVKENRANNLNFNDGRTWTYNTQKAFTEIFSYWSRSQVRTVIKNCVKNKLILEGEYNKVGYDKTKWYTLSDKMLDFFGLPNDALQPTPSLIGQSSPTERLELTTPMAKTSQPIPIKKPIQNTIKIFKQKKQNDFDNDTLSKYDAQPPAKKQKKPIDIILKNNIFDLPEQAVLDYEVNRKAKRAPITPTVIKNLYRELNKCVDAGYDTTQCFEIMVASGWSTLRLDWIKNVLSDTRNTTAIDNNTTGWLKGVLK